MNRTVYIYLQNRTHTSSPTSPVCRQRDVGTHGDPPGAHKENNKEEIDINQLNKKYL